MTDKAALREATAEALERLREARRAERQAAAADDGAPSGALTRAWRAAAESRSARVYELYAALDAEDAP